MQRIKLKLTRITQDLIKKQNKIYFEKYNSNILKTQKLFESKGIYAEANKWLLDLKWKIPVAGLFFDDLINDKVKERKKILEIAGSISWFTLELLKKHNYSLIEQAYHENFDDYSKVESLTKNKFVQLGDWYDLKIQSRYDIILAKDLLPNVDQRLIEFYDKIIPLAKILRMTLTYSENVFYEVKRLESGETLYMRPWGLRQIKDSFNYLYENYEVCSDKDDIFSKLIYKNQKDKIFKNNRNIIMLEIENIDS